MRGRCRANRTFLGRSLVHRRDVIDLYGGILPPRFQHLFTGRTLHAPYFERDACDCESSMKKCVPLVVEETRISPSLVAQKFAVSQNQINVVYNR